MTKTIHETEVSSPFEASSSAVNWNPIVAGAFAASTLTLILMLLGSGLGLTMISPWSNEGIGVTTFAISTAIWLIIVQWLSSAAGGYLTGRLRTKWVGIHTDETFFRDSAHGLIAWALATLLIVMVFGSVMSTIAGKTVEAASNVAAGVAMGASAGEAEKSNPEANGTTGATSYFVDALFRPADAAHLSEPAGMGDAVAAAQASRILVASAASGEIAADDKIYLGQLVAARTGLSQAEATERVNSVLSRVQTAKVKAQEAADTARKATSILTLLAALSMLIGAFISSAAAALGGQQRDDDEAIYISSRR